MQPKAKTLVLVSGASDRGRRWQKEAIAGLQPFLNKYDTELGQPLASILANAQAAQSLLSTQSHDKETILQILEDIVEEDLRAGQVIHRLRTSLKRGEHQSVLINLNDLIQSTLRLIRSELINRRIKVDIDFERELPLISGDPVQIQQVLLNLMMNAMEAMTSSALMVRRLSIATRVSRHHTTNLNGDAAPRNPQRTNGRWASAPSYADRSRPAG